MTVRLRPNINIFGIRTDIRFRMGVNLREYLGNFICNVTTDPAFLGTRSLCVMQGLAGRNPLSFLHTRTKIEYGRDFRHPTATAVVRAVAL